MIKPVKNEKAAEIVGLAFGDGSLTTRKNERLRFQMRGHIEENQFYNVHVISLLNNNLGHVCTTHYQGKKPYYGIYSERKDFCNSLRLLGVPTGVKKNLTIPSWIKSNKTYLIAFIRGLVDTDGSVFCGKDYNHPELPHKKIRMSIGSVSAQFILEISMALKSLGVPNLILKPFKQKDPKHGNLNKIQIDTRNVADYFDIIGSNNVKHTSKYDVWRKFGFCPPYTSINQRLLMLERNPLTPTITLNAEVAEPGQMRKFIPKRLVEETSVTNALSLSGCEGSNIQKGCESPFLRI